MTQPRSPRRQSSSAACSSSPAAPPKERRSCAAPRSGSRPGSRYASSSRSRCWASATPRRRPGARPRRRSPPCEIRAARHADVLRATTLAALAMEEVLNLRSASTAIDLAERALAAGLPLEPLRGENWAQLALAALGAADGLDVALRGADEILAQARARGRGTDGRDPLVASSAHRGAPRRPGRRRGGRAGGDRARPRPAGRRVPRPGGVGGGALGPRARRDPRRPAPAHRPRRRSLRHRVHAELPAALRLRRASRRGRQPRSRDRGAARLRRPGVRRREPGHARVAVGGGAFAGRARAPRRGTHPGRRRGAPRAVVRRAARDRRRAARRRARRPPRETARSGWRRRSRCWRPRRRDWSTRVCWSTSAQRSAPPDSAPRPGSLCWKGSRWPPAAAPEPWSAGRGPSSRRSASGPERTERAGADSLTPSERRVVELAATGGTNREIAQTLFVTEKTVETHLGRSFRKLDISSRRQLPDVLASGGWLTDRPAPDHDEVRDPAPGAGPGPPFTRLLGRSCPAELRRRSGRRQTDHVCERRAAEPGGVLAFANVDCGPLAPVSHDHPDLLTLMKTVACLHEAELRRGPLAARYRLDTSESVAGWLLRT